MAKPTHSPYRRKGARPLADLVAPMLDPLCVKRGFGSAALISYWADIVGADYEYCSQPEQIDWPKRHEGASRANKPATLTIRVTPAQALYVQHDIPQIQDRINQFLGYQAIGRIRIVQGEIKTTARDQSPRLRALSDEEDQALKGALTDIQEPPLQEALLRLGRAVTGSPK